MSALIVHPAERRLVFWLLVLLSATFLLVQEGAITGYDGQTVFEVTRSLLERGTLAVPEEFNTLTGPDGLEYSRYGLGLSLVAAIPYLVVRPITSLVGHRDHLLEAAASSVMAFVTAALVVAMYLLARRIGGRPPAALFTAVGAVVGTFVLPYSKEFFSEPLTALCLVFAIERILARRSAVAGLAFGAAVLVRAQSILFAPVLLLVALLQGGPRSSFHTAAGAAPGILLTFAYNFARFGDPLRFGYEDVGFTTPFLTGVSGLLFEPRKSLLLFAPVAVLLPFALWRLRQQHRSAFLLLACNLTITFLVSAMWFAWHGGWCWGPRLLIPGLVPAIAALAPWLVDRSRWHLATLLFVVGFGVSLPALIVPTQAQQLELPPVPREGHFLATQPLGSPWPWRQAQLVWPTARYSWQHRYEGLDDGRNYLRYLSLWQLGATRRLQRAGLLVTLAGTILLLALILRSGSRVRAALERVVRLECSRQEAGRAGGGTSKEFHQVTFQFTDPPVHAGNHQSERQEENGRQ